MGTGAVHSLLAESIVASARISGSVRIYLEVDAIGNHSVFGEEGILARDKGYFP